MKQAQLLVDKDKRQYLYVPEESIRFTVLGSGNDLIVAAFRTDGMHTGGISMKEWIEKSYTRIGSVSVRDDIVAFAVESEKKQQAQAGEITKRLKKAVRRGMQVFDALCESTDIDNGAREYVVACEILALIAIAEGR